MSFGNYLNAQTNHFESEIIKCNYKTNEGKLNGLYVSHYKNGQKKSEGNFENNYRIGKWSVWDSTGELRMVREYKNPFIFKRIVPSVPNNILVDLLNIPQDTLGYNDDNYIAYFPIGESNVIWSKRLWRIISIENNPILFNNNRLFNALNQNILNKNLIAYNTTNDQFREEIDVLNIDTSSLQVIGYRIKEDVFFCKERLIFETRIIGLCPIVFNKIQKDTVDLYWVYFPKARKILAKELIADANIQAKIKSLDDLFFYRYFDSEIYKSGTFNKSPFVPKTKKEKQKYSERINIGVIEHEHNIWISLTKKEE